MINILLEGYGIEEPWLYRELKHYINPKFKVAVAALSFRDDRVRSLTDWNMLYGKTGGKYYARIVRGLCAYGISEDNISFINYFTDTKQSAVKKIEEADIIYFTGGLPDRMTDRIDEMGLRDALMKHDGIVMGYSAGALVQLSEYHLTPDDDYTEFGYYKGLGYVDGFYLEVHYEGSDLQKNSIRRVVAERRKNVYATHICNGAVIVREGQIKTVGEVEVF